MATQTRTKRHKKISKQLNQNLDSRKNALATKLDNFESDYYDSPNRLAEDSENDDFNLSDDNNDPSKKVKTRRKRITKRTKKESSVRRNFNLQKLIKEENLEEREFPNFVSMRVNVNKYPMRSFCSICGITGKYTCPRCGEKYCSIKCHNKHKDLFCLKFDI